MRTILLGISILLSGILTAQTNNSPSVKTESYSNLTNEILIRGNWFKADAPNQWEYGIYDSVCIIQNQMFTNKGIRKQGDCIELTVQDKKNAQIATLLFTPQPNGDYLIKLNEANELLYTKEASTKPLMTAEADFKEFIRKDTAYLQGYVDRFDRETYSDASLIMISNNITGEGCPTIISINPDGSFECKLVLNHPIENILSLGNHQIAFYIEPGQTLSIYVDDEGSYDNIKLMGPSAALSQMYDKLRDLKRDTGDQLSQAKEGSLPDWFKKETESTFARYTLMSDSLAQAYAASSKAAHLIRNKLAIEKGTLLLSFTAYRSIYAARDTANQALKVKEGNDYYDFLKPLSLNDESLLADWGYRQFINLFEFMNPLKKVQSDAYDNKFVSPPTNKNLPNVSDKKLDKQTLDDAIKYLTKGDSVINQLSGQSNTFLWQTTLVRRLKYDLKTYSTPAGARKYIDALKKHLTYPILIAETNRIFNTTFSKKADKTYQLPDSKATGIFRNIIKPHFGKLLFVDFWATSCGGCRAGIESTAQLRKGYKNHPEFQFIYITDERSSPTRDYDKYVAKNLAGEVSYRISETDFQYLRELFKFNGIPHYELIQKDGSVTVNSPTAWELEEYIKKYFEKPAP